jgi:WD40 repeat protein
MFHLKESVIENPFVCEYKGCKLYYENPVTLPCGSTICKEHLPVFVEKFMCVVCDNEHQIPEGGLVINKAFEKIIKTCLHLNSIQKDALNSFNQLNLILDELESLDSNEFIYDYFAKIRNQVDFHRENLVKKINDKSDEIILKLKNQEEKCKLNALNLPSNKIKNETQLFSIKNQLRNPSINTQSLKNYSCKMKLDIRHVRKVLRKYKSNLLLGQTLSFEKTNDSSFGKLIESDICLDLAEDWGDLVNSFNAHQDCIRSIQACQYSNKLITASCDKTIKIWNLETGVCLKTLDDHEHWVTSILIGPSNKLVSASVDQTIKIWDLNTYECLNTLIDESERGFFSLCFLSNNNLASGSRNGSITIWDLNNSSKLKSIKAHDDWIPDLKLFDSSKLISCGGKQDYKIKIWSLETFECLRLFTGHSATIYSLEFNSNGNLISGSGDRTVKVWNIHTGECIKSINFHNPVYCVKPIDNKLIAVSFCSQKQKDEEEEEEEEDEDDEEEEEEMEEEESGDSDDDDDDQQDDILIYNLEESDYDYTFSAKDNYKITILPNGCLLGGSTEGIINVWKCLD